MKAFPPLVSPFDAYALEAAARIKDKDKDTKIVVLSMGPEQALAALKECLSVGGDKAYLVSDRACGGPYPGHWLHSVQG